MGTLNKKVWLCSLLTMVFILGLSMTVCQAAENWADVEAKARKEGKLLTYSVLESRTLIPAAAKALKKKYGITLENMRLLPMESLSKLKAEAASKTHLADIASMTLLDVRKNPQFFSEWGRIPEAENPQAKWIFNPFIQTPGITAYASVYGITVNTKLVPEGSEPKTWKELADPKWRGKMIVMDPTKPSTSNKTLTYLYALYGKEWLKKLLMNDVTYPRNPRQSPTRVQRGEFAMYPFCSMFSALRAKARTPDLPIKFIIPEDGAPGTTYLTVLVKNAPHPNAAKVFINWLMSMEGQETVGKAFNIPLRPGLKVPFPQWQDPSRLKFFDPFPWTEKLVLEDQPAVMKLAKEILGK